MIMKKCFKCNKDKELSGFYVHKYMADGYLGKCIECTKKDVLEHRKKNIERIRAYDRERGKLPHRIKGCINFSRKYRKDNPLRESAGRILRYAVKTCKILKPRKCSMCYKEKRIMGHHEDYYKPLKVIWVCQICHKQLHKEKTNGNVYSRSRN